MAGDGDRRGFLKEIFRSAARATSDFSAGVSATRSELAKAAFLPEDDDLAHVATLRRLAGRPTKRAARLHELGGLMVSCGLGERSRELLETAQPSVRLTLVRGGAADGGRSRIGGSPDLPAGVGWPRCDGRDLAFLAQVDLAALRSLDLDLPLPPDGLLLFFYDVGQRPATAQPHDHGARVLHVASGRAPAAPSPTPTPTPKPWIQARPLRLSGELVLPRPWSPMLEPHALGDEQVDAWADVRELLAREQGVELAETSAHEHSLHRLLGYPDETRGDMPLACELLTRGESLEGTYPFVHPGAADAEPTAARWRLLLQLFADDDAGIAWGDGADALFFWIDAADLRAGDFSRVVAIVQ